MCKKIMNLTPHPLTIIAEEDCVLNRVIRKWVVNKDNVTPIAQVPSYGVVSARTDTKHMDPINGIPVMKKDITSVDPLPKTDDPDTVFVVSVLYANAYKRLYPKSAVNLYTIADPVYTADGRTVLGSRGICKVF